jgi:hypothetical protein
MVLSTMSGRSSWISNRVKRMKENPAPYDAAIRAADTSAFTDMMAAEQRRVF